MSPPTNCQTSHQISRQSSLTQQLKNRDRLFGIVRLKDKAQLVSSSVALLAELVTNRNMREGQKKPTVDMEMTEAKWLDFPNQWAR